MGFLKWSNFGMCKIYCQYLTHSHAKEAHIRQVQLNFVGILRGHSDSGIDILGNMAVYLLLGNTQTPSAVEKEPIVVFHRALVFPQICWIHFDYLETNGQKILKDDCCQ